MRNRIEISTIIKKKTLALTLAVGAASFAFAQEKVAVSGKVVNSQNAAVPYASVTFTNAGNKLNSDAALTDVKGNYTVELVPGNYEVTVEAIDYKKNSYTKQIVGAGNIGTFKIVSESSTTNTKTQDIQGIVLTAATKPVKVEIDKKVYDVKSDITAVGGNLQDVLQNVPSVTVDPDGTVSMRGSSNVKFLVNGKPSALLGIDDGANALQSIPADQIDHIEVITNPSAKFDASGTAGILNIILKKNNKLGFNGSVIGTLGYLPKTGLNTNLNWKKGKWTWFANGGGGYQKTVNKNWSDARYTNPAAFPLTTSDRILQREYQNSGSTNYMKNYNGSAGVVYDINDHTSVNASVTARAFNMENNAPVTYTDYLTTGNTVTGFRNSLGINNNKGFQGDFGLDHKFDDKGQNISLALSLQRNDSDGNTNIDQNYRTKILQELDKSTTQNKSLVGKIDYELPIGEKSSFSAGYKVDSNHNNYSLTAVQNAGPGTVFGYSGLEDFNNNTEYRELINAFYAQFKSKIDKFGYQIGLRDEMSNIRLSYLNMSGKDNINDKHKDYNGLFPSVFLSYDIAKDNQFLLNYSRRIDRPRSFFLVPYMNHTNSQNVFRGNPDLDPSYIDSFEFGYNVSKRKFTLNPTLYYRKETQDVKRVTTTNENGVFETKPVNLGYDQRYGLDMNFSFDAFSWWKWMGEADVFGHKTTGTYIDPKTGQPLIPNFDKHGVSARLRLSTTFKVDKTFNIQLQGQYRSRQSEGASDQRAMYFVNAGATKTIMKGDGTIAFNIQDIFNTRAMHVIQNGTGYSLESYMQWQPRQASLSFTYRFKQGAKIDPPKRKPMQDQGGGDDPQQPM